MIVEAPKNLKWRDVVKVLATIFDFELSHEEPYVPLFDVIPGSKVHMRKGRVHAVVLLRSDGVACVDLHEDVGKSAHHKVLTQTRKLNTLSKQLSRASVKYKEVCEGKSSLIKLYIGNHTLFRQAALLQNLPKLQIEKPPVHIQSCRPHVLP